MVNLLLDQGENHAASATPCYLKQVRRSFVRLIKYYIYFTSIFMVMSFMLVGCGDDQTDRNNTDGMSDRGEAQNSAAIPVQVAAAERGDISLFLMQTTAIEAESQVDILAKVSGQVAKLPAEEGIRVKKGDLLAQLDEDELRIAFLQAKVVMETDKAAFERAQNMLEKNLIAEEGFETTRLQYESSKTAYEAARLQLEYTSVRSPFDGVITARNVELGQRVNANQSLFRIADFDPLRAKIYVPEKDMGRTFEGQIANIKVDALPNQEFSGIVKMISPVVDPASGTSKVTIDVDDHQGKLKPGMFASVFINTETHSDVILIPKKALILESDLDQVYVYQEGIAHKVTLELDFTTGDQVEVVSGLQIGDLVVTVGQEGLREGLPIKIPGQEAALTRGRENAEESPTMTAEASGPDRASMMDGDAPLDLNQLKRMEERMMRNPENRDEYEKRLKEDPDLKDNPEKKMAFFREIIRKRRARQGSDGN